MLNLHFEGEPLKAIILLAGDLSVAAQDFPPFGQLDVFPFVVVANGLEPGGLNPFFFTDFNGEMNLSITVPFELIGDVVAFQAALLNSETFLALSNAVQVSFLP